MAYNRVLGFLHLCACTDWKVTEFCFEPDFFALLPKYPFFQN